MRIPRVPRLFPRFADVEARAFYPYDGKISTEAEILSVDSGATEDDELRVEAWAREAVGMILGQLSREQGNIVEVRGKFTVDLDSEGPESIKADLEVRYVTEEQVEYTFNEEGAEV